MVRIFLLAVICFFVSPNSFAAFPDCTNQQCLAVVDAGSTGSRIHIYSYVIDESNTPDDIKEVWVKKIKPGFATIDSNQTTVNAYLDTLFSDAPTKNIPVYFYATAGMRLLPASKQQQYYKSLKQWFKYNDNWSLVDARTITGSDEALFDWLSVNYNSGTLKSLQTESIGVMDMGGASVQVVFPLNNGYGVEGKDKVQFTIYGQAVTLYVHSFLGLGQTEMSHQFLDSVPCFSNNYPLPDGLFGQGDAASCVKEVSSLLNDVHGVDTKVQPIAAANPVDTWYAIGGINNIVGSSMFQFDDETFTNDSLLSQANSSVCQQSWSDLSERYTDNEYLYEYCLLSSYFYALMVDGYGIHPERSIRVTSPSQNVDWTTGVVLIKEKLS